MCETDIKKAKEDQILILIDSAHRSERYRIANIIMQKRDKLNTDDEVELRVYNALNEILMEM